MNNNICIITSYIDINRENWNNFKRKNEDYVRGFKPYLLFKEDIIVFIDSIHYNFFSYLINCSGKQNIKLISIDENFLNENIESWSYIPKEDEIINSDFYKSLVVHRKSYPENSISKYNVVQHCKLDFIRYVITNNLTECEYLCWSDFGFFMNKEKIPEELELGKYSFNLSMIEKDKVNYCLINDINEEDNNVFGTLLFPRETIGGFFFLANKENHLKFNRLYKEVLRKEFYDRNLVDDDQHIVLQCYFKDRELFNFYNIGWHNTYKHFSTYNSKFTIISPISIGISQRCSYLQFINIALPSYDKYLNKKDIDKFIIICSKRDYNYIKFAISNYKDIPFCIYTDDMFVPDEVYCNGYTKQQLIKLKIAKFINTKYYLPVDGDLFLVKKLELNDLFHKGKVKYSSEPYQEFNSNEYSVNSNWVKNSCNVLNYPIEDIESIMSVTPQILSTTYVNKLLDEYPNIIDEFNVKNPTEFTLYWIYLLKNKLTDIYIDVTDSNDTNPIWKHDLSTNVLGDMSETEIEKIVENALNTKKMHFCVIQSYLRLNTTRIRNIFVDNIVIITHNMKNVNTEENFKDIISTVLSIRKNIPNTFIILEEISNLNSDQLIALELIGVNKININDDVLKLNLDETMSKLYIINKSIDYIMKDMNNVNYSRIFKIDTKTTLNEDFNLINHKIDCINVKKNIQNDIYSNLISFGKDNLETFNYIFKICLLTNNLNLYLEKGLYFIISRMAKINFLDTLGCNIEEYNI